MAEPIWISASMVRLIHADQISTHGGAHGLRDEGLLESALARPQNKYQYESANLHQLAASYGFGIARNHPFIDGNKRTAFQVTYVFLKVNGWGINALSEEVVSIMQAVASYSSEEQLAEWLKQSSHKE